MHRPDFEAARAKQGIQIRNSQPPGRACPLMREAIGAPFDLANLAPQGCEHIAMRVLLHLRSWGGGCGNLNHGIYNVCSCYVLVLFSKLVNPL